MFQISNPDERTKAISALANIRQEWQQAADGESLLDIRASVGLLLDDITRALACTAEEQLLILGADLTKDLI